MLKNWRWQAIFFIGLMMGCAGPHHLLINDYEMKRPRLIAVLPVQNETVHLKAPELFRPIVHQKIGQKGYETLSLSFIDQKLAEKDIHEAGQVHSLPPQELGRLLGADALLYTTITEFSTTYLVAYASITVAARFELRDARSGELLWQADHQVKDIKAGADKRGMQEVLNFAVRQSYVPYAQKVTDVCFTTLPNGPLASAPAPKSCLRP